MSFSRLLLLCAILPSIGLIGLLSDGLGVFPALAGAALPESMGWLALMGLPLLICMALDRAQDESESTLLSALLAALALLGSALLSAGACAHLYAPGLDLAALAPHLVITVLGAFGVCFGLQKLRVCEGVATLLVVLLLALPAALHIGSELASERRIIGQSFSPALSWYFDAAPAWGFMAIGVLCLIAAFGKRLIVLRKRARAREAISLLLLALALATPALGQSVDARFMLDSYLRPGEHNPLQIECSEAPRSIRISVPNGASYELIAPERIKQVPVFLPAATPRIELSVEFGAGDLRELKLAIPTALAVREPRAAATPLFAVIAKREQLASARAWSLPVGASTHDLRAPQPVLLGERVPQDWRMLSCFDAVVVLSPNQLEWSYEFEASLSRYLVSGGTVILIGAPPAVAGPADWVLPINQGSAQPQVTYAPNRRALLARAGAGKLLRLPAGVAREENLSELIYAALALSLADGGLERPWGASPHAQARGPLVPMAREKDFARTNAEREGGSVALLLVAFLAGLAATGLISLALPRNAWRTRIGVIIVIGVSGLGVLIALLLPLDARTLSANFVLASPSADARAMVTEIRVIDPSDRAGRYALADHALATPYNTAGAGFSYAWEAGVWSIEVPAGSALRVDLPCVLALDKSKREFDAHLHENTMRVDASDFSQIAPGETINADGLEQLLVRSGEARIASSVANWVSNSVRGARDWRFEITTCELPKLLLRAGEAGNEAAAQRVIVARPLWRGPVIEP